MKYYLNILRRGLFFVYCLLLPSNLGKHFEQSYSYISGIVVDYLVPVVYFQDILLGFLFLAFMVSFFSDKDFRVNVTWRFKNLINRKIILVLMFFLAGMFFSTLRSPYWLVSGVFLIRTLLGVFSFLYVYLVYKLDKLNTLFPLALTYSILAVCTLAFFQIVKQGSVFNNYLFFGEQPYSSAYRSVVKEVLFGKTYIPPYSLFRHPNTFAGFLTLSFPFLFLYFHKLKKKFILGVIIIALAVLILTLSWTAILGLLVAVIFSYLLSRYNNVKNRNIVLYGLIVFSLGTSLLMPHFGNFFVKYSSVYRRGELMEKAYENLGANFLFGYGPSVSTALFNGSVFLSRDLTFYQPVHNVFVLLLLETGAVSLIMFLFFLFTVFNRKDSYSTLFLFLIVFIGIFDHYLITQHQTYYLFWLTSGMILSKSDLLANS